PHCGERINQLARKCRYCGEFLDEEEDEEEYYESRRRRRRPSAGGAGSLIPYENPKALVGYYCAVFGLIPCLGLVLGPTALAMGIIGLRYVREKPDAGGTAHAWVGILLGGLDTLINWGGVLLAIVGIVAASIK